MNFILYNYENLSKKDDEVIIKSFALKLDLMNKLFGLGL